MAIVTIVGSGMMGSALAFPARENGHEVRLVGTHLDKDIGNDWSNPCLSFYRCRSS